MLSSGNTSVLDCLSYTYPSWLDTGRGGGFSFFLVKKVSTCVYGKDDISKKNGCYKKGVIIYVLRGFCNRVLITVRTGKPP